MPEPPVQRPSFATEVPCVTQQGDPSTDAGAKLLVFAVTHGWLNLWIGIHGFRELTVEPRPSSQRVSEGSVNQHESLCLSARTVV